MANAAVRNPRVNIVYNTDNLPVNATPLVDPGSPNARLPPPAAPVDPRATDTPEPASIDPDVDRALNSRTSSGKTVAEESTARTMDDLRKYAELNKLAEAPDDRITLYYKFKKAEAMLKDGIPTGPDPKDPRVPATTVHAKEACTGDIFDKGKIEAAVKDLENDPDVQRWMSAKHVYNLERILDEKIGNGEIADVPKDPESGLRSDTLKRRQSEFVSSAGFTRSIASLPRDKQQEAMQKAVAPFLQAGSTVNEAREQLFKLVSGVAGFIGQPLPAVDGNFDFVHTPEGQPVVGDPSGHHVALDKEGKAILDEATMLPKAFSIDGKPVVDALGRPVSIAGSGDLVSLDDDGNLQVLGTDKYGNEHVPLTNPEKQVNKIIIDKFTNAPVELDAGTGRIVTESLTGYARVIDTQSGRALRNPANGNAVVADPAVNAAVEVDKSTGKVVADEDGNPVVVDPRTGYRVRDKSGNAVVADKESGLAVILDGESGIKTIMNPKTGAPLLDPKEGVTAIIDPDSLHPVAAVTDRQAGSLVRNTSGQIVQLDNDSGLSVVVDAKTGTKWIVDPVNGAPVRDTKGNTLAVDKDTGLPIARGADGKEVVEAWTGARLIYDAKTGHPLGKPEFGTYTVIDPKTSLPVEVDPFGQYTVEQSTGNVAIMDALTGKNRTTQDGKVVTIDMKSGLPTADVNGRQIVVNGFSGEYVKEKNTGAMLMIDPATSLPVYLDAKSGGAYIDPATGGTTVANPVTGEPQRDVHGNLVQVNPETGLPAPYDLAAGKFLPGPPNAVPMTGDDGTPLKTADGKRMARDGVTGHLVVLDPSTNQPVKEANSGLTQIVDAQGHALKDAHGNPVVIDKGSGKPIAVDTAGKAVVEEKSGYTRVHDPVTGKAADDEKGNPVVLDKVSDAPVFVDAGSGELLKDPASGMVLIADPATGKALVDPETGNKAVLDADLNAPVQVDAGGKVVADGKGRPYIVDTATGGFVKAPGGAWVVSDKITGLPVVEDPKTGVATVVDPATGAPVIDPGTGGTLEVNKNTGMPQLVKTAADGTKIVMDPRTGKQMVDVKGNGAYIDPDTGQMVVNDPGKGVRDYLTGKVPEEGVPTDAYRRDSQVLSAIKSINKAVYSTTFDFNLFDLSPAAQEFKNSKLFGAGFAIASIGMAVHTWGPRTEGFKALERGDQDAWMKFSRDVLGIIKDDTHFIGGAQWLTNFFKNSPGNPLNNVAVAPNGDIVKFGADGRYRKFIPARNVPGSRTPAYWETQSPNYSLLHGEPVPAGAVRMNPNTGGWERFNVQSGKWESGSPYTAGPGSRPNSAYAGAKTPALSSKAASLFKTLGTAAKWLSIGGGAASGGLGIYFGIKDIIDGARDDDGLKIASGAFNILSGVGYIGWAAAAAFGVAGAFGPAMMVVGYAASFIATIIDIISNPDALKSDKEVWARKVMEEFAGADVFAPDARAKLERWFDDWAREYYEDRKSQDGQDVLPLA